jgi:2-polyprenyl-3-methyl-5-hydroxy-6-metoxy-1,4-benzoquinol methylase
MADTEKALLEEIGRHDWYQSIDLGNGIATPGETGDATRAKLEMMDLPEDMTGMSVLDIGCNEGFFAFEAWRRGARRVLALDKSREAEAKFDLVKRITGAKVEFRRVKLTEVTREKDSRFDLVFFLSVFHHLRHPLRVIDHVASLTRGRAVMEFVEAVPQDDRLPSALVRKLSRRGHLHMLPTRKFLLEILGQSGFDKVEILGEHRFHRIKEYRDMPGFDEQRVVLSAQRN